MYIENCSVTWHLFYFPPYTAGAITGCLAQGHFDIWSQRSTANPTITGWPSLAAELQLDALFFKNRGFNNEQQRWNIKRCYIEFYIIYSSEFHFPFLCRYFNHAKIQRNILSSSSAPTHHLPPGSTALSDNFTVKSHFHSHVSVPSGGQTSAYFWMMDLAFK